MKKCYVIAAIVLALSMLFSMVACQSTGTKDPETKAPEASDTAAPETDGSETDAPETDAPETDAPEADVLAAMLTDPDSAFEIIIAANITMEQEYMELEIPLEAALKYKAGNASGSAALSLMGMDTAFGFYFDGDNLYIDENGDRYYLTPEELSEDLSGLDFSELSSVDPAELAKLTAMINAADEILKDYTVVTEDGVTVTTTITLPKAGMMRLLPVISEQSGIEMDASALEMLNALDITDFVFVITTENDIPTSITANGAINGIPLDEEDPEALSNFVFDFSFNLVNLGGNVEIDVPEDLEEYVTYTEYTESTDVDPDEAAMAEIAERLYDTETLEPVENFEEAYAACVAEYGQELVDRTVAEIQEAVVYWKVMELYDFETMLPVEDYEEKVAALAAQYGEENVSAALSYVQELLAMFSDIGEDISEGIVIE